MYKSDPYGFHMCTPPENASKVYDLDGFLWKDSAYRKKKSGENPLEQPINIYEVHLGSWKKYEDGNYYSYEKAAEELKASTLARCCGETRESNLAMRRVFERCGYRLNKTEENYYENPTESACKYVLRWEELE